MTVHNTKMSEQEHEVLICLCHLWNLDKFLSRLAPLKWKSSLFCASVLLITKGGPQI